MKNETFTDREYFETKFCFRFIVLNNEWCEFYTLESTILVLLAMFIVLLNEYTYAVSELKGN